MKFFFALFWCVTASVAWADENRTVAAFNAPLAYYATTLGGDAVEVFFPSKAYSDPALWDPRPEDILALQNADIILLNGAGYEDWSKTAILPRSRLVDTSVSFRDRLIPTERGGPAHRHGPGGELHQDGVFAFTTWLDPNLALLQMRAVAQAMSERWPALEEQLSANAQFLAKEIKAADETFADYFALLKGRQIIGSHPVYQYLDRAYDLDLISVHWEPDTHPSDVQWSDLKQSLNSARHPIMLWEDTPLPETSAMLRSLGVEVVILRPLANGDSDAGFFLNLAQQINPS